MILMWLGSFVLMMFGLAFSQKTFAQAFASVQGKVFDKGLDGNKKTSFLRTLSLVALEASPQRSLYAGLGLYNLRVLSLPAACLLMCMSTLGAWWMVFLGLSFMSYSGLFILGICSLSLVSFLVTPNSASFFKVLFPLGLFLVGGEMTLKNSSILMSSLAESDFVFFLADGRFTSVFGILLIAIVISLFVQIEFWSVALALVLLFTNVLSLNGALGLLAGERIGRMLLVWWHSRGLNQDCRRLGAQFALVSGVGAVVGLFLAGAVRELIMFGYAGGMESLQEKNIQFVALFAVILFTQFLAQMIWGHFASQFKVDELQDPRYISKTWFQFPYASEAAYTWAKAKVHKRLSEIRYHLQGAATLKEGQLPGHIHERLRQEEKDLSRVEELLALK